jgi:hypothetical protein
LQAILGGSKQSLPIAALSRRDTWKSDNRHQPVQVLPQFHVAIFLVLSFAVWRRTLVGSPEEMRTKILTLCGKKRGEEISNGVCGFPSSQVWCGASKAVNQRVSRAALIFHGIVLWEVLYHYKPAWSSGTGISSTILLIHFCACAKIIQHCAA